MLRIWGRTNSINVQKVLWCCAELDLPFERIDAGMAFGVVETPAYRALNPNGRIPTIEDDGYVLWESNTIVRYLAMKHSPGPLCPSDLAARFDAERWMDWQLTTLDRPVRNVFWALVRTAPEKRDPAAVETAQAEAEQALAILDAHLAQRRFVGGEAFTMGDIPVGASVYRWLALDLHRADRPQGDRRHPAHLRPGGRRRPPLRGPHPGVRFGHPCAGEFALAQPRRPQGQTGRLHQGLQLPQRDGRGAEKSRTRLRRHHAGLSEPGRCRRRLRARQRRRLDDLGSVLRPGRKKPAGARARPGRGHRHEQFVLPRQRPLRESAPRARVGGAIGRLTRRQPSSLRAMRPGGRFVVLRVGTGSPQRSC